MKRILIYLYAIACYVMFLATSIYAVFFISNILVLKTVDSGHVGTFGYSLLIDLVLVLIFALQHTVMARPAFKHMWTRLIPKTMERSTYVLFSNLTLILLFWQWRPLPGVIWTVNNIFGQIVLWGLFIAGWIIMLTGSFMISHADLFGLEQASRTLKNEPAISPEFMTPGYYKYIRHPLMLGFIISFWATPFMTVGHLILAILSTVYILVALRFEEHDLITYHGNKYIEYKKRVPMLIPFTKRK